MKIHIHDAIGDVVIPLFYIAIFLVFITQRSFGWSYVAFP
jgi:hypothetical protein